MPLTPATDGHLRRLMSWFPDAASCARWGGPTFRHPFDDATFRADARWDEIPTFVLEDPVQEPGKEMLAFGQIYPLAGRCHLARLAVAPEHRRRGIGRRLVGILAGIGRRRFEAAECSLFVRLDNGPAVSLYRGLGFTEAPWPEEVPRLADALFLVAPVDALEAAAREPES